MRKHILIPILLSVLLLGLEGCGEQKYSVTFEGGQDSGKMKYSAGETVTVYYPVATDTDYFFSAGEDISLTQDYDPKKGVILSFTMPARDVSITVKSRNTMMKDPYAIVNPGAVWTCPACGTENDGKFCSQCGEERPEGAGGWTGRIIEDNMVFDYFDAVTGTVGGDHYTELTLYTWDGEGLILARYSKSEGQEETCQACQVPTGILDDCMKAVQESALPEESGDGGMTGRLRTVKYKEDGQFRSISSEDTDSFAGFDAVGAVLADGWSEYYVPGAEDETTGSAGEGVRPMAGDPSTEGDGTDNTALPEEEGDPWFCPSCGRRNTGSVCLDCGLEKPEE